MILAVVSLSSIVLVEVVPDDVRSRFGHLQTVASPVWLRPDTLGIYGASLLDRPSSSPRNRANSTLLRLFEWSTSTGSIRLDLEQSPERPAVPAILAGVPRGRPRRFMNRQSNTINKCFSQLPREISSDEPRDGWAIGRSTQSGAGASTVPGPSKRRSLPGPRSMLTRENSRVRCSQLTGSIPVWWYYYPPTPHLVRPSALSVSNEATAYSRRVD